jgi:ABC-type cobalt transport system substrate-binding protein
MAFWLSFILKKYMRTFIVISCVSLLQSLVSIGQTNSGVISGADGQPVAVVDDINGAVVPTINLII